MLEARVSQQLTRVPENALTEVRRLMDDATNIVGTREATEEPVDAGTIQTRKTPYISVTERTVPHEETTRGKVLVERLVALGPETADPILFHAHYSSRTGHLTYITSHPPISEHPTTRPRAIREAAEVLTIARRGNPTTPSPTQAVKP